MMLYQVNIGEKFEFGPEKGIEKVFPNLGTLISTLLPNIYILAGVVFFFLLIFGGFGLIMGAGGGDPQKTEQGKKAVTMAVVGFLIIFLSYWLIQLIEVITNLDIFKPNF